MLQTLQKNGWLQMKNGIQSIVILAPMLAGCVASIPVPTQSMADAKAAERKSAAAIGLAPDPASALSLHLAQEEIAKGQKEMADGNNGRASALFVRATVDAELALAQTLERNAKVEGQKAATDAAEQKSTNVGQGAVK
jgi:hypothetical protein